MDTNVFAGRSDTHNVKSLVAMFMYNLVQNSELDVASVAVQIENHYKTIRSNMELRISEIINSMIELNLDKFNKTDNKFYSRKIYSILETNLKSARAKSKDIDIVCCYNKLLNDYNDHFDSLVSIPDDKKKELIVLLNESSIEKVSCGFSKASLERYIQFLGTPEHSKYQIIGFIDGFISSQQNSDAKRMQRWLITQLNDDDLKVFFSSYKRGKTYYYKNVDKESIAKKLKVVIDLARDASGSININELSDLLQVVFDILKAADESQKLNKVNSSKKVRSKSELIDGSNFNADEAICLINEFYSEKIRLLNDFGVLGVESNIIEEIFSKAVCDSLDDMHFIFDNGFNGELKELLELPSVSSLMIYRFYRRIYLSKENKSDYLNQMICTLFNKASSEWNIILHPYAEIMVPVYIGYDAILFKNTIICSNVCLDNDVKIIPFRTTVKKDYCVRIGSNSYLGKRTRLFGNLILEESTLLHDSICIYEPIEPSNITDVKDKIKQTVASIIVKRELS